MVARRPMRSAYCNGRGIGLTKEAQPTHEEDPVSILSRSYSCEALAYRDLWAPELLKLSPALLQELPLSRATSVLDAGTGVGSLLPQIQEAAPNAFVVGVDIAEGMVALASPGFGRSAMNVTRLAFRSHTFDVGIMAFVLFHLPDPTVGLGEMARVIRPGGALGTVTWGDDPSYRALDVWRSELDRHGAANMDSRVHRHELVDTPEKMRDLLLRTGFELIRTWSGTYESRMTVDQFIAHRTTHGVSKRRLDSLDPGGRAMILERARKRLEALTPPDFIHRAEVVYAVATVPSPATIDFLRQAPTDAERSS
jgi:SAM-dependent methyltransferase